MQILTTVEDGVLRLQIHRPEKKNALTVAMYSDMAAALMKAEQDPAIRVVLIHGYPDVFSSGNDLQDFMNAPPIGEDQPAFQFLLAISSATKPIVAAVTGPAIGIGTTMLLHCDLVYAAESARFQLPFVNLALVPEAASSLLLPAQIGYRRAAELLMLGEPFSAVRAMEYGLLTEITSDGDGALTAAKAAARQLAGKPPAALRLTKMLMKKNTAESVAKQMSEEAAHFVQQLRSPEAAEALKAFYEKRAPDFSKFS